MDMDGNGMEWTGMEWNGMEWIWMEWKNGMEWKEWIDRWNGMEWIRISDRPTGIDEVSGSWTSSQSVGIRFWPAPDVAKTGGCRFYRATGRQGVFPY